jgi:hypothetical protein
VIASRGADRLQLAIELHTAVVTIEQGPRSRCSGATPQPWFHEVPIGSVSNVDGDGSCVRIQVHTNAGALDRDNQLAGIEDLTRVAAIAAGNPSLVDRTWVVLSKRYPAAGAGRPRDTNDELVAAARAQIAELGCQQ